MLFIILMLLSGTHSFSQLVSRAHRAREGKYDVKFYFLDLNLESNSNAVSGNVMVRSAVVTANTDTFAIELASNFTIDSVKASLNGAAFQTSAFLRSGREVNVLLPFSAQIGQLLEVRIFYGGTASASNGLFGPFNTGFFTGTGHKFSASPPYSANTWYPCKQVLSDKADSSWFFITTTVSSDSKKALSNGNLTAVVPLGNGKSRFEWKNSHFIDFYLIAFCVGSFSETTDYWQPTGRADSMQLKYYSWTFSGNRIQKILQLYSDLFGFYPFYDQKLGLANVSLGGGIENQTMIMMGNNVEVHEIAHQWWGDNVTCGSWKDVMLNEGFATWCESAFAEYTTSGNPNQARMGFFTDNTSTTPVYGVSMDTTTVTGVFGNANIYYKKASMVINSLRFDINDDTLFYRGLKNYQQQFSGKSALGSDFIAVMEAASGKDLTEFFNQWYYKGGAPTFNIVWNQVANELMLRILETTNSGTNPLFRTPVEIKVLRTEGDTTVRLFIGANVSYFSFNCPGTITGFTVDPNQWITNGSGTVSRDLTLDIFSAQIVGNPLICNDPTQNPQFSAAQVAGRTYEWTISGGVISTGQGTSQITVTGNGEASLTLKACNASGSFCDSTTTTIFFNPVYNTTESVTINTGDSLFLMNEWQTESGSYVDNFTTIAGCDSTVITNLTVGGPLSTGKDLQDGKYQLVPNPVLESFSITGIESDMNLQVYTVTGQRCVEINGYKINTPVDVQFLSRGIYIVKLIDSGNSVISQKRLIKQ